MSYDRTPRSSKKESSDSVERTLSSELTGVTKNLQSVLVLAISKEHGM